MMKDDFGDRMKEYEGVETSRRFSPTLPVYVRIDGRGFSKFTRGLKRPFDERMSRAMINTTARLVEETKAVIGYTQSDEISLLYHVNGDNPEEQIFFDGKVQKLASVLAGMASSAFLYEVVTHPEPDFAASARKLPHFDARVFALPSREEATNAILWRTIDATRNAIQMTAHDNFSHKALHGVPTYKKREMIREKGIDYDAYPAFFRWGSFLRRVTFERTFTDAEWNAIPEPHRPARDALFTRSEVREIEMPSAFVHVANRMEVIFDGAEPIRTPKPEPVDVG